MLSKSVGTVALAAAILAAPLTASAEHRRNHNGAENLRDPERYELVINGRDRQVRRHARSEFGTFASGIDRRIQRQRNLIRRGRRAGDLTRGEARRLRFKLFNIRMARRYAKLDGAVTPKERHRLHAMLDRNSQRIRRLRNNGRHAGAWYHVDDWY